MAIIISQNNKNARRLEETGFPLESSLQEYIYENPESIPLYDISEDMSLLILAREFMTTSGPIDALGVDMFGNIYVVETKLYKNPDKRQVIAQAIDYGAALWKHAGFTQFVEQLDSKSRKQFGVTAAEKITDYFGEGNTEAIFSSMEDNLANGTIKFVVLMDQLEDRLKDLVLYVNQNSQFDIYAVEMKYFKHETFEILIPDIFGAEAKKMVRSTNIGSGGKWQPSDEQAFLDELHRNISEDSSVSHDQIYRIYELNKRLVNQIGGEIEYSLSPAKTARNIKMLIKFEGKYNYALDTRGEQSFYLYKKQNPQIDIYRALFEFIISEGIFGKDESLRGASQFFITINNMRSQEEVEAYIHHYQAVLENAEQ